MAAITQLRYPCEGREYYDRKRAEGKNTKEAIRALKRQISNVDLPGPASPTLADSSSDRQAREDNQARHEIQRDRLNILNGRLFGSVTPGPDNQPYNATSGSARGPNLARPRTPRKPGVDTKRLRTVRIGVRWSPGTALEGTVDAAVAFRPSSLGLLVVRAL